MFQSFPNYNQLDKMDCGPTCLRIIAKHYGRFYSLDHLRKLSFITREGVSMLGISEAAENIGFRTSGVLISFSQLANDVPLPCILHWNQNHFVVCYRIEKDKRAGHTVHVSDPDLGLVEYTEADFLKSWHSSKQENETKGAALLLEPSPKFYENEATSGLGDQKLSYFFKYLSPYKREMLQVFFGMLGISLLQLIFPFLTQSLVDVGVLGGDLDFITLVLVSQLVISVSQLSIEIIQGWIMINVNSRINIALISDFLIKLMSLPIKYFDTKIVGDIMQRIGDHKRIETFLTGNSIGILFSCVNLFVFALILAYYDLNILLVFVMGNTLYIGWVLYLLKYRRKLDNKRFTQLTNEQSNIVQMITGMQEIKLNNYERQKRWQWERIQVKLFNISVKGLALSQIQQFGSVLFNRTTNIIITFIAAKSVVEGDMTLGMMVSLTYIIGQLNGPVIAFINFAESFQDAKISLERLNEIHNKDNEAWDINHKLNNLPLEKNLSLENVSFSYDGADRNYVLNNISLVIPQNKVTAIVGGSGSGKTTLIKLLLGFYEPNKGTIKVGTTPLNMINPNLWRSKSGSVMQDGFIFSETIAENIAMGHDTIDSDRLYNAVKTSNILDFIQSLPLGFHTKIGMEGNGISQGQRQRILIARAVYKSPEFIFLDEATNALDANNEKEIMQQLNEFYKGRTVVVVAHRLSTVRTADNIVVLQDGKVAEEGTHDELTALRGKYYQLVKNQLELGN